MNDSSAQHSSRYANTDSHSRERDLLDAVLEHTTQEQVRVVERVCRKHLPMAYRHAWSERHGYNWDLGAGALAEYVGETAVFWVVLSWATEHGCAVDVDFHDQPDPKQGDTLHHRMLKLMMRRTARQRHRLSMKLHWRITRQPYERPSNPWPR